MGQNSKILKNWDSHLIENSISILLTNIRAIWSVYPRRHRGLMQPLRFFWDVFFVYCSYVTIFSVAFRSSFYVPPENFKTLTSLIFDLWRHNWDHVRRKCVPWHITCKHRRFCMLYECGRVVPSSTHAFHRSSGPVQVNRGQLRSNEVNGLCRLLLSSTAFLGNLRRWFRFRHSFYTKKSWNEVMKPPGHQRSMTSYDPKMILFRFLTPKNHPWAFKNHRNVSYSSQGTCWALKFCSSSIRSKVIGDHGISSLFGTGPVLRGHWLS